jgi:deoxyribonuclease V
VQRRSQRILRGRHAPGTRTRAESSAAVFPLHIPDLPAALTLLLRQVPPGTVTTYGDLAEALGDLKAAKWVAEFLLHHDHGDGCHCFRVVRRTGEIGLYVDRDSPEKANRLRAEGIAVAEDRVDLECFRFADFTGEQPLRALAERQNEIPQMVKLEPLGEVPEFVAGVDVSYRGGAAFAAYAVVETAGGELVDSHVVRQQVEFPYISGYLAYRELPALLAAIESLPASVPRAEVVFVDGNGLLHRRGAGIATHFGVLAGLRTIGVGKKLLCGTVSLDGLRPAASSAVTLEGRTVGAAVKSGSRSRPIFVSVGHRTTLPDAVRLTQLLFHGHRLPEPLYHADRLSRQAANDRRR